MILLFSHNFIIENGENFVMRKIFSRLGFFVSMAVATTSLASGIVPTSDPGARFFAPAKSPGHFEIIGALGIAKLKMGDSTLGVDARETDKLVQTNNQWNTFAAQLGVGYVHYFRNAQQYSDEAQWFPAIEPELNLYYLGSNSAIKGDALRYGSSDFNDFSYTIPVHSTRLMLDAALTIMSWKKLSVFAIGGIGNAWNRVGYRDQDKGDGDCSDPRLNLNSNTRSSFVWEIGGGVNYAFNNRVGLSLEYLYTDLGKVNFSAEGDNVDVANPVIVPARFRLKAQTVLLGLHIAL